MKHIHVFPNVTKVTVMVVQERQPSTTRYSGERLIREELTWADPIGEFRTKLREQASIASNKTL